MRRSYRAFVGRIHDRAAAAHDEVEEPLVDERGGIAHVTHVRAWKEDDRLVGRLPARRQVDANPHPLSRRRQYRYRLHAPLVVRRFSLRAHVERQLVVVELAQVGVDDLRRHRRPLRVVVREGRLDGREQRGGRRRGVPRAADAMRCRALGGRPGVVILKHVGRLGPSTAENVPAIAGRVPRPLLDVTRHVVGAERPETGVLADGRRRRGPEVARAQNAREDAGAGRLEPVMQRRQRFSD